MLLKKINKIINKLLIIVPLLLISLPFLNGYGCHGRLEGKIPNPSRNITLTCSNGIYDIFNYFPDGSIRHQKGLFGYFLNTAVLISFTQKYIIFNLSNEDLKIDVINKTDKLFKLRVYKVDERIANIEYFYDSSKADNIINIKALYNGKLGFIDHVNNNETLLIKPTASAF